MKDSRVIDALGFTRSPDTRPTIGYLIHAEALDIIQEGIRGAADAARDLDANLICFLGGGLDAPGFQAQANILYALADAEIIDGLLIHTSGVGMYVSPEEMGAFARRYRPVPCLSSAGPLQELPCVSVGRRQGMRGIVTHLIEVHDCQRIAFIRGPEKHSGAQERYQGYLEALAAHNLPLDVNLVTPPTEYSVQEGTAMITMLLDERGLRPQTDFQAIVAASDEMALGVLEALRVRGIRVPDDVAVVDYNDSPEAGGSTPPLTTVRPPYYEKARQAVELLLTWVQDKNPLTERSFCHPGW